MFCPAVSQTGFVWFCGVTSSSLFCPVASHPILCFAPWNQWVNQPVSHPVHVQWMVDTLLTLVGHMLCEMKCTDKDNQLCLDSPATSCPVRIKSQWPPSTCIVPTELWLYPTPWQPLDHPCPPSSYSPPSHFSLEGTLHWCHTKQRGWLVLIK